MVQNVFKRQKTRLNVLVFSCSLVWRSTVMRSALPMVMCAIFLSCSLRRIKCQEIVSGLINREYIVPCLSSGCWKERETQSWKRSPGKAPWKGTKARKGPNFVPVAFRSWETVRGQSGYKESFQCKLFLCFLSGLFQKELTRDMSRIP